jgi:hypothetical protein
MPHVPEPFKPDRTLTEAIKALDQLVTDLESALDRARTLVDELRRAQAAKRGD